MAFPRLDRNARRQIVLVDDEPAGVANGAGNELQMRQDCPECQRLWREYAAATTTHIGLENKLRVLPTGSVTRDSLTAEIAKAATVREQARQAIHQHEATAHGMSAGASEIGV